MLGSFLNNPPELVKTNEVQLCDKSGCSVMKFSCVVRGKPSSRVTAHLR